MSKQIVISGHRILAHGEDCFLAMGGVVICQNTGRIFQNATVANVDEIPADIDAVGYEFRAGKFVPCAPYGIGNGNIAVLCPDSCKALKDSGIPLDGITHHEVIKYTGAGKYSASNPTTLTFNIVPEIVFINTLGNATNTRWGWISGDFGIAATKDTVDAELITVVEFGKTVKFYASDQKDQFNASMKYRAVAFGKREG